MELTANPPAEEPAAEKSEKLRNQKNSERGFKAQESRRIERIRNLKVSCMAESHLSSFKIAARERKRRNRKIKKGGSEKKSKYQTHYPKKTVKNTYKTLPRSPDERAEVLAKLAEQALLKLQEQVEVHNPRINVRKFNETSEQYAPMVTSPFSLSINDSSQILPHNGDIFTFTKLLNLPTKPLSGFVPLRDIHNGGETMKERIIDLLGAVKSVGSIRTIKTKTGQEMQIREVIIFDHTSPGLKISLWDAHNISRAANWKPRTTILFITDTKLVWSSFLGAFNASATSRSIITENPVGKEAAALAEYAKNAPLAMNDILDQFIMDLPDPQSIQNVMCVQQVLSKIDGFTQTSFASEPQITALMFVAVTQLDLDGPIPVTRIRCSSCKSLLTNTPPSCENAECLAVTGAAVRSLDPNFDIKVNLSDHTGTLTDCRMSGAVAEQVLNCTVQQFLRMPDEQKTQLKWKYLMERCAVRIVVLIRNRRPPRFSIVSCSRADPLETAQRIPLC